MKQILKMLNSSEMRSVDVDQSTAQAWLTDPEGNWNKIQLYVCRYFLIHLRNYEKRWHRDLDELLGDTMLYSCLVAKQYVDRKLYTHYERIKGRGKGTDAYVELQTYCFSLKPRILNIFSEYCKANPASELCSQRTMLLESELNDKDEEYANSIIDYIKYGGKDENEI